MQEWLYKKVLVAGGAGFIGSRLVHRLVNLGADVTVLDNLKRGRLVNLKDVLDKIEFKTIDLKDPITEAPVKKNYDYVFDFAARVFGIRLLNLNPGSLLASNLKITINILETLSEHTKHYVYASSSCVYDYPDVELPHIEVEDEHVPQTAYGVSKSTGEQLVKYFSEEYGFKYTMFRFFNVYGPYETMLGAHVIPEFMYKAYLLKNNETSSFEILGDGEQTRSFLYVEDGVDALLGVANPKSYNEVFNVGTEFEMKIKELAKIILTLYGLEFDKIKVVYSPVHPRDIKRRCANSYKIWDKLGWIPKTPFIDGLKIMKEYMDEIFFRKES